MSNMPLKGQRAALVGFAWGHVRCKKMRFRQTVKQDESTGAGDGYDANFNDGVRVRSISFTGIVVDGTPDLGSASVDGFVTIQLDGTVNNQVAVNVIHQETEFVIDFEKGADIDVTGTANVTGPMANTGEGTHTDA